MKSEGNVNLKLNEIERLLNEATRGPWSTGGIFNPGSDHEGTSVWGARENPNAQNGKWIVKQANIPDCKLIVALRNYGDDLIATIRRQQEEIAGLRKLTLICNNKPHGNQCSCWDGSECDCDAELPSGPAPLVRIHCAFCGQIEEDPDTHSCSDQPQAKLEQEDVIEDYWDQNSVTCSGCGAEVMARGVIGNNGLSDPVGCELAVCARCLDADHNLPAVG